MRRNAQAAEELRATLVLLLGACGIGFAPIFAQLAINAEKSATDQLLNPVGVGFWRMFFAAPFFWFLTKVNPITSASTSPYPLPAKRLQHICRLGLPGVFFALDLALWHWSFQWTTVANATLATNMATVIVPIVSWFYFGERFNGLFPLGTSLALLGMARLVGFHVTDNPQAWYGDLLGLGSAFAYAAYLLTTKSLLKHYPARLVMAGATSSAALGLCLVALMTPGHLWPMSPAAWLNLLLLAIVSQVAGQGLIARALASLPASYSSLTLLVQPVVATIASWWILGQKLSVAQAGAIALVISGIFIAARGRQAIRAVSTTEA